MYKVSELGPIFWSAAIRYVDPETNCLTELYGKRHHEIIAHIRALGHTCAYKKWHEDGFLVSEDESDYAIFMDREKSTELARKYNIPLIGSVLTSEDLW